jgi:hypothetical protein
MGTEGSHATNCGIKWLLENADRHHCGGAFDAFSRGKQHLSLTLPPIITKLLPTDYLQQQDLSQ